MTADTAHKLQIAADIISDDAKRRGEWIDPADALHLARRLHAIHTERVELTSLKPGEIAQRFRQRYTGLDAEASAYRGDRDD